MSAVPPPDATAPAGPARRATATATVASPEAVAIGSKLRLRRKRRKLSLKEVSEKSGLSIGLLSLVERGLTMPSVRSMRAICEALEMPVLWLFDGAHGGSAEQERDVVVRQPQRRRLAYTDNGIQKELLSPDTQPDIQMLRFVLQPGADSGDPYSNDAGGKCGIVLRGTLGLALDTRQFTIATGDSFAFDARQKVRFWAEGSQECEVIWVVAPPTV